MSNQCQWVPNLMRTERYLDSHGKEHVLKQSVVFGEKGWQFQESWFIDGEFLMGVDMGPLTKDELKKIMKISDENFIRNFFNAAEPPKEEKNEQN